MDKDNERRERIVVIGGGFAGLTFAKAIDKSRFDVTLVDRNNYHSFPPLFYQVASAELDPASISFPFRRELSRGKGRGVRFHMGHAEEIDVANHTVVTDTGTLAWDRLIIATGTTNNFFGNDELRKHVYTLKSTPEALRLRNEVLDRMEMASACKDADLRRAMLTFVVVGGGPTGVEIAGALGGMKRYVLAKEYPGIDPGEVKIILLEGSGRLLSAMSEKSSDHALEYLNQLMVDVRLNTLMSGYERDTVTLPDGSAIATQTVIWTAGITGESIRLTGTDVTPGHGGRFATDGHCRVVGLDNVWALGDIGVHASEKWPRGLPQLAQPAIQQARYVAKEMNAGHPLDHDFEYRDKGSMATIGRNRAVVDMGSHTHLGGFMAWLAWMMIHLMSLLGMRNRVVVFINWVWAYFSLSTSLRVIIRPARWPERRREKP